MTEHAMTLLSQLWTTDIRSSSEETFSTVLASQLFNNKQKAEDSGFLCINLDTNIPLQLDQEFTTEFLVHSNDTVYEWYRVSLARSTLHQPPDPNNTDGDDGTIVSSTEVNCTRDTDTCSMRVVFNSGVNDFADITFVNISWTSNDAITHFFQANLTDVTVCTEMSNSSGFDCLYSRNDFILNFYTFTIQICIGLTCLPSEYSIAAPVVDPNMASESVVTSVEVECIDETDNCTIQVTFNSSVNDFASVTFVVISWTSNDTNTTSFQANLTDVSVCSELSSNSGFDCLYSRNDFVRNLYTFDIQICIGHTCLPNVYSLLTPIFDPKLPSDSFVASVEVECTDETDNCTVHVTFNSTVNNFASFTFLNISWSSSDDGSTTSVVAGLTDTNVCTNINDTGYDCIYSRDDFNLTSYLFDIQICMDQACLPGSYNFTITEEIFGGLELCSGINELGSSVAFLLLVILANSSQLHA
ncbi:uncharacterized protein LOC142336574 [Convolutriloba macropyga]|uniref:uncharacterized protein LOC142336574 n=1 Tax=Convolutriloba macropyga TaxID=536237 RepID=UPI003F524638